jgi:ABC-type antimicrobial peptide transport system permease subunit
MTAPTTSPAAVRQPPAAAGAVDATRTCGRGGTEVHALAGPSLVVVARRLTAIMGPSAVGATRGQVGNAIHWEAAILAARGTLLGVVVGVVVIRLPAQDALLPITVPWSLLSLIVVAGAVVGVLAALGPAWCAARIDVLRALEMS